jgi:DNA helicase-2/ATP-dependent DNA helicase PcrA
MEVRDNISYLKLALNPNDSIALQRVINSPPRGIGRNTIEELQRRAKDFGVSLWETISLVFEKPEGLSARAVSALRGFRRIVLHLAELTGTELPGQTLIAESNGKGNFEDHNSKFDIPTVSEIVKAAILDTGYEAALRSEKTDEADARLDNLQELVNAAVDYDDQGVEGLREFIDHSALVSDADQYKRDAPVTLMTAHSAKGLEFPLVFIVGLEDGLFPHSRSATDQAELEEERRLAYVAMTRAEKYLYVTHAMKRRVYGEELASEPSQFLNEMPLDLMEDFSTGSSWLSFARGSSAIEYEHGEYRKERGKFSGKTYDSVDSIAEFFKQRNQQLGRSNKTWERGRPLASERPARSGAGPPQRAGSLKPDPHNLNPDTAPEFIPGSYVRHAKYGRGLVLRREGAGDSTKLTVSFPGYGQKKLVQKYAGLEKA